AVVAAGAGLIVYGLRMAGPNSYAQVIGSVLTIAGFVTMRDPTWKPPAPFGWRERLNSAFGLCVFLTLAAMMPLGAVRFKIWPFAREGAVVDAGIVAIELIPDGRSGTTR